MQKNPRKQRPGQLKATCARDPTRTRSGRKKREKPGQLGTAETALVDDGAANDDVIFVSSSILVACHIHATVQDWLFCSMS